VFTEEEKSEMVGLHNYERKQDGADQFPLVSIWNSTFNRDP